MSLESSIERIADALFALRDEATAWRNAVFKVPKPAPFTIKLISENRRNDMDFLTYEATLPEVPSGTDVASQSFTFEVDGNATSTELPKEATTATFEVPQGATVLVSLTYTDDAGNISAAQSQTFVAVDSIAPDAPGAFQEIRLVSERTE